MSDTVKYSYRKAAKLMGIAEDKLAMIVKTGKIAETPEGLVDENTITRWKRDKADVESTAYLGNKAASASYELNSGWARDRADHEAEEHFKKEVQDYADAIWNKWNAKARKDLEAKYAEIEKRRLQELKELGL